MGTIELTKNEREVLVAIVGNSKAYSENNAFVLSEIETDKSKNEIAGTVSSLNKKGMITLNDGESYFDGEVTEAGLETINADAKVTNLPNFDAPVKDERLEKLNEIKSVKMSSISSGRRPKAREAKDLAAFVIENWNNISELQTIKVDDAIDGTVRDILISRLSDYKNTKVAKKASAGKDKAESKTSTPAPKKDEYKKVKAEKIAPKVGYVHPKHATWVWTEYKPGKFDWRTAPAAKKPVGRKAETKCGGRK